MLQRPGAIGIVPTDTVYGIVAHTHDRAAVERLYRLKHRERKPGAIIAASIDELANLGIERHYLTSVDHYWPGPISVVIPCSPKLGYLHQGVGTLAVRIPANGALRALLVRTGPLITSSANPPGKPVATTIDEAKAYFGGQVDFYIDGGNLSGRKPSTILRITNDTIEVLRQGAAKIELDNKQGQTT